MLALITLKKTHRPLSDSYFVTRDYMPGQGLREGNIIPDGVALHSEMYFSNTLRLILNTR